MAAAFAVVLRLIQDHIPPSEVTFVTSTCVFCILFVIITADPTTVYTIVGPWLPFEAWRLRGRKSIQFLQRGEKLVADATAATDGDVKYTCKEQSKDSDTSPPMTISRSLSLERTPTPR